MSQYYGAIYQPTVYTRVRCHFENVSASRPYFNVLLVELWRFFFKWKWKIDLLCIAANAYIYIYIARPTYIGGKRHDWLVRKFSNRIRRFSSSYNFELVEQYGRVRTSAELFHYATLCANHEALLIICVKHSSKLEITKKEKMASTFYGLVLLYIKKIISLERSSVWNEMRRYVFSHSLRRRIPNYLQRDAIFSLCVTNTTRWPYYIMYIWKKNIMALTFGLCTRSHVVIDQLSPRRKHHGHGVIVKTQVAMDQRWNVARRWKLLSGDGRSRRADAWWWRPTVTSYIQKINSFFLNITSSQVVILR